MSNIEKYVAAGVSTRNLRLAGRKAVSLQAQVNGYTRAMVGCLTVIDRIIGIRVAADKDVGTATTQELLADQYIVKLTAFDTFDIPEYIALGIAAYASATEQRDILPVESDIVVC